MTHWSRPLRIAAFRGRAAVDSAPRADLWIHGASLGEIAAAASLLRVVEGRSFYVTSGTPEGLARARQAGLGVGNGAGPVGRRAARRLLDAVRPRALWLVESELWPGVLAAAAEQQVPVAVVGARLSARSHARYGSPWIRGWFKALAARVSCFATADRTTADRLIDLGVDRDRVHLCGRIKVPAPPDPDASVTQLMGRLVPGRTWIVGGCTHPGEERALLDTGAWPLLLAPRHLERLDDVCRLVHEVGRRPVLRSTDVDTFGADDVLILDTIGELAAAYQRARWSFVGGSLTAQAHDLLEPLVAGSALLCGPRLGLQADEAAVLQGAGVLHPFDGNVPDHTASDTDPAALLEQLDGRRRTLDVLRRGGLL